MLVYVALRFLDRVRLLEFEPSAGQLRCAKIPPLESVPHNHIGPTDTPMRPKLRPNG